MTRTPLTTGRPSSPIWIIGEAPGADEIATGIPFVGAAGRLLDSMLTEAGIQRHQCYLTNVCHDRPPGNDIDEFFYSKSEAKRLGITAIYTLYPNAVIQEGLEVLYNLITDHRPQLIIALGSTALWALTGLSGIGRHRGSVIPATALGERWQPKVIPTWHPISILREWSLRAVVIRDLRRARHESEFPEIRKPAWRFTHEPILRDVILTIENILDRVRHSQLPVPIVCDIETRAGHISCVGIAWSRTEALCIPFMRATGDHSYWDSGTEYHVTLKLRALLTHPRVHVIFQNGAYDLQYFAKEWGYLPNFNDDTMLMQHVAFPGMLKGLAFLSSLYCEYHRYWKDDGKNWDPALGEASNWIYNCEDCVRTFECWEALEGTLKSYSLWSQYRFQIDRLAPAVIKMMLRGIRISNEFRTQVRADLVQFITDQQVWLETVLGHPLNVNSTPVMKKLFYEDLRIPPVLHRKTRQPSLDDSAMDKIERRNPLLHPLFKAIRGIRTARTTLANVINQTYSPDDRARSTINLAGTETFRFSSSEDAFGHGGNLQNITKGNEGADEDHSALTLPNIRRMFTPDPGYTLFEVDLKGADARVVAWEADDAPLKQAFRDDVDIHAFNAETIWKVGAPLDAYKTNPVLKPKRHRAKTAIHAINYGCKGRTLSEHIQATLHEAEAFIHNWFREHPNILAWHNRTNIQLGRTHAVVNKFGYRRHYFDRIDGLLPEALAWIGQSTTAIAVNHVLVQVEEQVPAAQLLLQTHDSITFQIRTDEIEANRDALRAAFHIVVPYEDPLEMPYEVAISALSWGDVKEIKL